MADDDKPKAEAKRLVPREPECLCHPTDVLHGKYHPECPFHGAPPLKTVIMGEEKDDRRTHVERINDIDNDNPANINGQGPLDTAGERREKKA